MTWNRRDSKKNQINIMMKEAKGKTHTGKGRRKGKKENWL